MEDLSTKGNVVLEEAGQGSSRGNQSAVMTDDHNSRSIVIGDELLDNIMKCGEPRKDVPKIQRIPRMLRVIEPNRLCYDPLVVSIGPYHHKNPEFGPMEKLKMTMVHRYVKGIGKTIEDQKQLLNDLYAEAVKVAGQAKKCYEESYTEAYDDDEFAKMMFLDGCFVIQFIYCIANLKREALEMETRLMVCVHRDLFLLENQLPFMVLEAFMSLSFTKQEQDLMLNKFMESTMAGTFHSGTSEEEPLHLLQLLRTKVVDVKALRGKRRPISDWTTYRSTRELASVGVQFRPSEKSCCFTDVKFEPGLFSGVLTLPPIIVDDYSKPLLLNLVAYEACSDSPDDLGVTSYVCLMDSLIDVAEDATKLRASGIVRDSAFNDQHVANLFNEMAINLVPNSVAYADVRRDMQRHCNRKIRPWLYAHFGSPWSAFLFSSATLVAVLTVIWTALGFFRTQQDNNPSRGL